MTEGAIVVLGTLAIMGVVAVAAIALVYNRALTVKASSGERSIEVQTAEKPTLGGGKETGELKTR